MKKLCLIQIRYNIIHYRYITDEILKRKSQSKLALLIEDFLEMRSILATIKN